MSGATTNANAQHQTMGIPVMSNQNFQSPLMQDLKQQQQQSQPPPPQQQQQQRANGGGPPPPQQGQMYSQNIQFQQQPSGVVGTQPTQQRFNMNGVPNQQQQQQLLAQQLQQQQAQAQAQAQQAGVQRPAMSRNTTLQQIASGQQMSNTNPNLNKQQFNPNMMAGPPPQQPQQQQQQLQAQNASRANSQGHTPQMNSQPFVPIQQQQQNQMSMQQQQQPPRQQQQLQPDQTISVMQRQVVPPPVPGSFQSMPQQQQQQFNQQKKMSISTGQSPVIKQPMGNAGEVGNPGPGGPGPVPVPVPGPGPSITQEQLQQQEINARIIRRNLGNAGSMRILDLIESLSNESIDNLTKIEFWNRVIPAYFVPSGTIKFSTVPISNRFSLHERTKLKLPFLDFNDNNNNTNPISHQFDLSTTVAPRFFVACVSSNNIARFSITLPGMKFQVMNNGSIFLISRLKIQFTYNDGSIADVTGNVKILMGRDLRMEWIDLHCLNYSSSIGLLGLERKWASFMEYAKSKDPSQSNDFLKFVYENTEAAKHLSSSGLDPDAMRLLQVGDIMSSLRSLMEFSTINNVSSPMKSLELLMNNNQMVMQAQAQMQAQVQAQHQAQAQAHAQAVQVQAAQAAQAQAQAQAQSQQNKTTVSSPSPLTKHAEEPKKKRRASSIAANADNKRRG
ncbi:MFG1 [[Candida] subhashii]|uniref:MFG1 n=1 Tax=[Candida] subhashii TaxID=561895 RepID=A0A8J5UG62_9ASCO|nr:MFG1 [[Candida] subhashii]KAG7662313.1 MFG1 [[Candida] subhashii]